MAGRSATRRGIGGATIARIAAACALLGAAAGPGAAAPRQARAAAPLPPPTVAPATPQPAATAPTPAAAGLCQCIADKSDIRLSCLASSAVCQTLCASKLYSFVPDAAFSCPTTVQNQPSQ